MPGSAWNETGVEQDVKETLSSKIFFFKSLIFLIVIGGEYHTYHQNVKKKVGATELLFE